MDAKEIIKVLEAEILKRPTDFKLKEKLAGLLLFKGDVEKARELYTQALKLSPDSIESNWGLARISWYQRIYEDTYFYLSNLSKRTNYQLTKEQALVYSKVLALKLNYKESSKWLDFAISQDSTLLREELPLLRKIRQKLITNENHEEKENAKKNQQNQGKSMFPFPPAGTNNIGFPFLFPISMGQGPSNQGYNSTSKDKNQKQFIILEITGGDTPNQANPNLGLPERERLSQNELDNISELNTFEQISGLAEVKQKLIQELIIPIRNPQICSIYSCSTNPKVLLYGPPGCGKSSLAKSLAYETGVTVFHVEPSDFLDLTFEEGEARLAYLVQQARLNKPSVLLFDEITWLAGINKQDNLVESSESRIYKANLLGLLFELLDEKVSANKQIALLATTSKPWLLDSYSFPLSKINSCVFAPPPEKNEKIEILKSILSALAKKTPVVQASKVNPEQIIEEVGESFSTGEEIKEFISYCLTQMMLRMLSKVQVSTKTDNTNPGSLQASEEKLQEQDFLTTKNILEIFSSTPRKESTSLLAWYEEFRKLASKDHPCYYLWKNSSGCLNSPEQDSSFSNLKELATSAYRYLSRLFVNRKKPKINSVLGLNFSEQETKAKKSTRLQAKAKDDMGKKRRVKSKNIQKKDKK